MPFPARRLTLLLLLGNDLYYIDRQGVFEGWKIGVMSNVVSHRKPNEVSLISPYHNMVAILIWCFLVIETVEICSRVRINA